MAEKATLQPFDYFVTVAVLAVPMFIGFLFAVKDKKKDTRVEYLFGGRQMSLLPVTLSMFVTFQSALSLIGLPTEVYRHGTGIIYFSVGLIFCYGILYVTFAPLIYPLEVTSIYEYLLLRYRSPTVRMLSTLIGCIQSIFYLSITLLTPALALQAVAGGIPLWMSVVVVGIIGTIYTVIGGIKSVIWTDVFQTVIVYVGIFAIIIKGSLAVGGLDKAWSIASQEGRVKFFEFSPDPRVRMTVWGAVLGSMTTWMITAYSQATLQRIRSLKSLEDAKRLYLTNMPLNFIYAAVLVNVGVVTFAYFSHIRCDPIKSGQIMNSNQIVPYFVLHAMNDLPGMTGLYMATLFCGSLSTLSSGINSLAANTVEDFLQRPLMNVSERTATICTKLAAAFHGVLICCLGYGAQYLKGPVIQMGLSVISAFGAPVLGIFIIGGAVPWANKYGAVAGAMTSLAFNLWISIGHQFHGRKTTSLQPAPIDRCDNFNSTSYIDLMETATVINSGNDMNAIAYQAVNATSPEGNSTNAYGFFLYDVSYEWYAVYGLVICLAVGLFVSFCTRDKHWRESSGISNLIFPLCRPFWNLKFPEQDKVADHIAMECQELI